jgi:hypothetical protein
MVEVGKSRTGWLKVATTAPVRRETTALAKSPRSSDDFKDGAAP